MIADPYYEGRKAGKAGKPHNARNSRLWKMGYADGLDEARDRDHYNDMGDWMLDPEMEAKG